MEKFIRTKNGIYEVVKNELGECIKIDGGFVMLEDIKLIEGERNIKVADTIDELIDGYYLYNGYDDEFKFENRIFAREDKKRAISEWVYLSDYIELYCRNRYVCDLYGFIETPKGLIFVAKAKNDEGTLCLI